MGNLLGSLKRFLSNKNTVTILALLAGVVVLWYGYNYRVNEAVKMIKVPYATERVDATKRIDVDKIEYKEITKTTLKNNDIITDISYLDGKYICSGTSIPQNGFFYESQICELEELPGSLFDNLKDGYYGYALEVTNKMIYAGEIRSGDMVDIYMSAIDDDGQILDGPLLGNVEVLSVRDSQNRDVEWDSEAGEADVILFIVNEEYFNLLRVAERIKGHQITLDPVLLDASHTINPGETYTKSETLYNFIMRNAASLPE